MVSSILTILCNIHHYPFPELFHLPKLKLCIHSIIPLSPSPSALVTSILFSVSMDLPILGPLYKWNHVKIFVFCVWFIWLSIKLLSFIYGITCIKILIYLWLNYIPLYAVVVVVPSQSHVQLLRVHEIKHARLPCPSLSPWVCSNSCPLSQWCHPTIPSSVTPFSSWPQSFPASGSFPMSRLFASGG